MVVSLSLVAVQLAASSYSSRVIDFFKNYPDLWIILFIYTYSIFYGLRILKIIIDGDNSQIEYDISTAFQLGMYVFIATIVYIYTIIGLLNPSKIIQNLVQRIEVSSVSSSKRLGDKEDPFQPVVDIAISSLMKYDGGTLADVLEAISSRKKILFYEGSPCGNDIGLRLFEHLLGLGKLAAERKDEYATNLVINEIAQIGVYVAENKLEKAAIQAAVSLGQVGVKAAENKLGLVVGLVAVSLGQVGVKAAENKFENAAIRAASALTLIREKAAENNLVNAALQAAEYLGPVDEGLRNSRGQGQGSRVYSDG